MIIDFKEPDIKFYFSFQCPYSFMAWEILSKILNKKNIKIAPIEIGNSPQGNTKYHFREIWGKPRWERLIKDADELGLKILQPKDYVSSLPATRAIEEYSKDNIFDYITSIFRAVFVTQVNISHVNSLRLHLQSEGLDSSIFADAQEKPETLALAKANQLLWGHERIRTIPTIQLEDERYSGLIDENGLTRFLRSILD
jgi:2-hydroxychromene-2-carboxylate isomerase